MNKYQEMTTSELLYQKATIEQQQRTLRHETARAVREQDTELSNALHALKDHYHAEELRLNNEHRAKRQALRDEEYKQVSVLSTEHTMVEMELAKRNTTNTDEQ